MQFQKTSKIKKNRHNFCFFYSDKKSDMLLNLKHTKSPCFNSLASASSASSLWHWRFGFDRVVFFFFKVGGLLGFDFRCNWRFAIIVPTLEGEIDRLVGDESLPLSRLKYHKKDFKHKNANFSWHAITSPATQSYVWRILISF